MVSHFCNYFDLSQSVCFLLCKKNWILLTIACLFSISFCYNKQPSCRGKRILWKIFASVVAGLCRCKTHETIPPCGAHNTAALSIANGDCTPEASKAFLGRRRLQRETSFPFHRQFSGVVLSTTRTPGSEQMSLPARDIQGELVSQTSGGQDVLCLFQSLLRLVPVDSMDLGFDSALDVWTVAQV